MKKVDPATCARKSALAAGASYDQADTFAEQFEAAVDAGRAWIKRIDRELSPANQAKPIDNAAFLVQERKGKLRQVGHHARRIQEIMDDLPPWAVEVVLGAYYRSAWNQKTRAEANEAEPPETAATYYRAELRRMLAGLTRWGDPGAVELIWSGRAAEYREVQDRLLLSVARAWQSSVRRQPQAKGEFLTAARAALDALGTSASYHTVRRRVEIVLRQI